MSPGALRRDDLDTLGTDLLEHRTVVLVVPETTNTAWCAESAWELARAASASGRRVALIDLSLREPALDAGTPRPPERGIVDAFLHGVSLSDAAQPQDDSSLHYVGVGSAASRPNAVWASDRWDRLAAGFRSEGALLLAYVPPQALTILALKPDGIVVLAPGGYDPEGDPSPGMKRLRDVGTPILATVVDDEVDEPDREGTASRPRHPRSSIGHRTRRDRQRRASPWQWILAIAAVVLVATVLLIPDRPPAEDPERPAGAGDSLYYAIQVASFDAVGRALEFLSGLERRELTGTVTPIRLGAQGIWHRVILGLFPSRAAADSALRALWASGAIEDGHGSVLRAPHALDLGTRPSADSARAEALALRERGVAAYVVRAPAGARVLVGAFEEPDQAGVAESLLTAAELRSTIAPRTGRSP